MNSVERIVVVGGGTAGWMSAVFLKRALGPRTTVTLVESDKIGTIGVGEASFNTLRAYFDYVGLSERDWMPATRATYKLGIKFVDWTTSGRSFFHPFQRYPDVQGVGLPEWWLHTRRAIEPFDRACFTAPDLCRAKRAPKSFDGAVFDTTVAHPYGYHFDAGLLATYLRDVAVARGVVHLRGTVQSIDRDEWGNITRLHLDGDRMLAADLYVDCTGFRGVLVCQELSEPWESFSGSLFCDRALATRLPASDPADDVRPYTTATALSSGWVWNIPLADRVGTGYVYSSEFLDDERALDELRRHLGPDGTAVEPRLVRFRAGRLRRSWVGNTVAIGLASSFVEPLESTAIFTVHHALLELVNHLPAGDESDEIVRASYNRAVASCVDGLRDFLVMHYRCNDRRDTPFWAATKEELQVPDELAERLALWRYRLPNATTVNQRYHGFFPSSYVVIMLGMAGGPNQRHPLLADVDPRTAEPAFASIREKARQLRERLPSHQEYLEFLRTADDGLEGTEVTSERHAQPADFASVALGP
jgi:tryptophan halogenase